MTHFGILDVELAALHDEPQSDAMRLSVAVDLEALAASPPSEQGRT